MVIAYNNKGKTMGIFKKSWSTYDKHQPTVPNPNPTNWRIIRTRAVGNTLVVEIVYPDCTNYEGGKVLLYAGVTLDSLVAQGNIDPHFCNSTDYHSPIARFEWQGLWNLTATSPARSR